MSSRSFISIGTWVLITLVFWILSFIIAESIPSFNNLLGLITALFASWFTYGMSGIFWLFLNKGQYGKNVKKMFLTALNIVIVAIGAAVCGIGLYASGKAIHDDNSGASWSCADNSS
jgi:hypothetical protein